MYDGRGLKCPQGFVEAKYHLVKTHTKVFLFDDDKTLYNFERYLDSKSIEFETQTVEPRGYRVQLLSQ